MKLWKKVLIGILILLTIILSSLVFLLGTKMGLHLLIDIVVCFVPGLSVKKIEGNWNNLILNEVRYERTGMIISARELHVSIQLDCLKHSTFCIDYLGIKDISGAIKIDEMLPINKIPLLVQKNNPRKIDIPYPITLNHISLHNVNLKIENSIISLLDFNTGLYWKDRCLTLTSTHINDLSVDFFKKVQNVNKKSMHSEVYSRNKYFGETLQTIFSHPMFPISLSDFHLPINIDIQEVVIEKLHFICSKADLIINHLLVKANIRDHMVQLQTLEINSHQGGIKANGKVWLIDNWPIDLVLYGVFNFDSMNTEKIYLTLDGALFQQIQLAVHVSGPLNAQLNIYTKLASAGLPLQLKFSSPKLCWPLTGISKYQIKNLNFNLTGKAINYKISLSSEIKSKLIPFSNLTIYGRGNTEKFNLNKLRLLMPKGYAELRGIVSWNKTINWSSELVLSHISFILPHFNTPITLVGKVITKGNLYNDLSKIHIPRFQIHGKMKESEIYVNGTLYGNNYNHWNIPGINLVLYHNNLDVKDMLRRTLKLNALSGINDMMHDFLKVSKVSSILKESKIPSLYASQEKRELQRINYNRLTLDINGNEKEHYLKLQINGTSTFGLILLNGGFNFRQHRWKGTISHTVFSTFIGQWRLINPIAIEYIDTRKTVIIGSHCWDNPHIQICFSKPITIGPSGYVHISLNYFDLAILRSFLPIEMKIMGTLSGRACIKWYNNGSFPIFHITINSRNLKMKNMKKNAIPVSFDTINLNADLFDEHTNISWSIHVVENGQFDGKIQIRDLQNHCNLSGKININSVSLTIVNAVLADSAKISGLLNSTLRIRGNLQQPKIYGQIELSSVNIENEFMPIDSLKVSLNMIFTGMNSILEGIIQTMNGKINLHGNAHWNHWNDWHTCMIARGNRVRISVPPIVQMDISPDLMFEASPISFNLNGRVDIPWMRIIVQNIPKNTINVSSDEVLIDKNLNPIVSKTTSIPVGSDLNIRIGDDVHISAFGLQANLKGNLKLIHDKHNFSLNGQISIPSGRLYTYGQDLLIRKGELQFSGPPDHPYINLESIRNPAITEDGIIAGLRINGLVDNLKMEIFSDPPMIYQETISYLLRGQGLSANSNNNALTSLLITLGISQGKQVISKIGKIFGVKNLSIDTTGVGDNQQVQISGYVFPDLQIKYGVGIFDIKKTFTLRYRLIPQLYLEVVSGCNQTIDLLYQFEF